MSERPSWWDEWQWFRAMVADDPDKRRRLRVLLAVVLPLVAVVVVLLVGYLVLLVRALVGS